LGRAGILVAGASGQLGRALTRILEADSTGFDLPDLDITDPVSVNRAVERVDPQWIINCAAVADVDLCERNAGLAMAVHRDGVRNLAATGRRLVTISTDHVFSGEPSRTRPFLEDDPPDPANVYAQSKLLGEGEALSAGSGDNIVIRTSWMYSKERGLVPFIYDSLRNSGAVKAVCDQRACITYAPDLARGILRVMESGLSGIFHLTGRPGTTPALLAREMSRRIGGRVEEVTWIELGLDAPRPPFSELATSRGIELPSMQNALERWEKRCH